MSRKVAREVAFKIIFELAFQHDEEATKVDETTKVLSFDEQINALLSQENNDNGKVRKKVA